MCVLLQVKKNSNYIEHLSVKPNGSSFQVAYIFLKKEDSIRIQNEKEIAIRDSNIKANKTQKWLFAGGMFLLTVIGVMLLYQNQSRKKSNEALLALNEELTKANQMKNRLFSILNHDLRSPLSSILNFLYLRKEAANEIDQAIMKRVEEQIESSVKNLLTTMEDMLLWSKSMMENFNPVFQILPIEDVFSDLRSLYNHIEFIKISFNNPDKLTIYSDENYLKTIMRNLTTNAVNVLQNTKEAEIVWSAIQDNGNLILSIQDNGPGAELDKFNALFDNKFDIGIKSGLGLHIVRDMATAIRCKLEVDSEIGKGTTIYIKFPDYIL